MAVLITGLGYIGAALARELLRAGETVVGLDNGFSTDVTALALLAGEGALRLVRGNVTSPRAVARAFRAAPIETVYHLAAQASANPKAATAHYTESTNLSGPRVVYEAALRRRITRVVYASSLRVYGHRLPPVVCEDTPYGVQQDLAHLSHIYGEKLLELYAQRGGWRATAVRLGVVYGVGPVMKTDERFMTVPNKFAWLAARGQPLQVHAGADIPTGFLHLEDACAALQAAASAPWEAPYQAVNAVGEVCTVPQVAALVAEAAAGRGLSVEVRGAVEALQEPMPKVRSRLQETGWRPHHTLQGSLGGVLEHFRGLGPA